MNAWFLHVVKYFNISVWLLSLEKEENYHNASSTTANHKMQDKWYDATHQTDSVLLLHCWLLIFVTSVLKLMRKFQEEVTLHPFSFSMLVGFSSDSLALASMTSRSSYKEVRTLWVHSMLNVTLSSFYLYFW